MLTKSLAVEWAKFGITVNAFGSAYFCSEMTSAFWLHMVLGGKGTGEATSATRQGCGNRVVATPAKRGLHACD